MKKKLLGYYDYTVILTYCGMLSAVFGIFLTLKGKFLYGALALMGAGVCDMFDGAVAATKPRTPPEKRFGIQIDSLSDLISFGVLPGLFVYCFMGQSLPAGIVSAAYILCALIRLAYFNVLEEERQQQTTGRRTSYLGVPVTTIAVLLPACYMLYDWKLLTNKVLFPALLLFTAAGFLTPVEIRKPHFVGKVVLVALGLAEAAGLVFLMGVDPL